MEKNDYDNELKQMINEDSERIINEIIELYNNNIEVNKSFNELVRERINPKYLYLLENYYINITKLIPNNLYICPNNKWALVDEKKLNQIIFENTLIEKDNENINSIIKEIVDDFIENKPHDFFDTINKYIRSIKKEEIDKKKSKHILDNIYYEIQKRGYTIISISPFKIEKQQ